MLPEDNRRVDVGPSFVLFTQYGKEVRPGTETYAFIPYNDIHETLGFNVLSLTVSGNRSRFPVLESSVQVRWSLLAGLVDDHVTEFLQNDIAHWGRVNGDTPLRRVPRHPGDENTRHGRASGPRRQRRSSDYRRSTSSGFRITTIPGTRAPRSHLRSSSAVGIHSAQ